MTNADEDGLRPAQPGGVKKVFVMNDRVCMTEHSDTARDMEIMRGAVMEVGASPASMTRR